MYSTIIAPYVYVPLVTNTNILARPSSNMYKQYIIQLGTIMIQSGIFIGMLLILSYLDLGKPCRQ